MNKKVLRIVLPVVIVLAVAGIWFVRNVGQEEVLPEVAVPLNIGEFNEELILSYNLPAIIDFGADNCIPCKEMAPVLVKLNAELQGKATIQFADVWKNPQAARGLPIQVIPTQLLINADGTPYMPSETIANTIPGFQLFKTQDTGEHVYTAHQGGLTEEQMLAILDDMGANL